MKTILKNCKVIVTCDDNRRQLYNHDIYIEDSKIVEMGENLDKKGAHVIDASGMMVFPGLVNMHHHFFTAMEIRTAGC